MSPESGSRIATLRLVGGRPAIDLVNTVSWRGDPARHEEHLCSSADALTWARRVHLLTPADLDTLARRCHREEHQARSLLGSLTATREVISRHLIDPAAPELGPLGDLIGETLTHSTLTTPHDGGPAAWTPPLDALTPARLVALDLLDYLTHPRGRLDTCDDPACRWAFLDLSRQQNRRWCSSADCGNRARARRHYQSATK